MKDPLLLFLIFKIYDVTIVYRISKYLLSKFFDLIIYILIIFL